MRIGQRRAWSGRSHCCIILTRRFAPRLASLPASPQCPPGKYLTANDHHEQSCLDCGVGKYNSQSGSSSQDDCLSCENGKYSDYTAATQESDCRTCDISTPNITPDQGECYATVGVSDLAGLRLALDQVTMGCCAAVGSHVTLQDGTYSKVHVIFPNTAPGWHGEVR